MSLKDVVVVINGMQEDGVIGRYAIGGATAANFYSEVFFTKDVDIFVYLDPPAGRALITLDPITEYLSGRGYYMGVGEHYEIEGEPVQFIPVVPTLQHDALDNFVVKNLDGVPTQVCTAEYLAAIAVELGRTKDKERLKLLVNSKDFDAAKFSKILRKHSLLDKWMNLKAQLGD